MGRSNCRRAHPSDRPWKTTSGVVFGPDGRPLSDASIMLWPQPCQPPIVNPSSWGYDAALVRHRSSHPQDADLFAPAWHGKLRSGVADLAWLLSKGYARTSSLKLVGDRYQLRERQRMALLRATCSDAALERRRVKCGDPDALRGGHLLIDGYNVLTTLETALGGGVILHARDRCLRDLAGVHGTWRRAHETVPALELVGAQLAAWGCEHCTWYLDQPVSNSGRLRAMIVEVGDAQGWSWKAEVVRDPDPVLAAADDWVATSDSEILDACKRWINLSKAIVTGMGDGVWIVDTVQPV